MNCVLQTDQSSGSIAAAATIDLQLKCAELTEALTRSQSHDKLVEEELAALKQHQVTSGGGGGGVCVASCTGRDRNRNRIACNSKHRKWN